MLDWAEAGCWTALYGRATALKTRKRMSSYNLMSLKISQLTTVPTIHCELLPPLYDFLLADIQPNYDDLLLSLFFSPKIRS